MATLRIHVLNGNEAGKQLEPAGDVIRISWKQQDMEALCDVLTQS